MSINCLLLIIFWEYVFRKGAGGLVIIEGVNTFTGEGSVCCALSFAASVLLEEGGRTGSVSFATGSIISGVGIDAPETSSGFFFKGVTTGSPEPPLSVGESGAVSFGALQSLTAGTLSAAEDSPPSIGAVGTGVVSTGTPAPSLSGVESSGMSIGTK